MTTSDFSEFQSETFFAPSPDLPLSIFQTRAHLKVAVATQDIYLLNLEPPASRVQYFVKDLLRVLLGRGMWYRPHRAPETTEHRSVGETRESFRRRRQEILDSGLLSLTYLAHYFEISRANFYPEINQRSFDGVRCVDRVDSLEESEIAFPFFNIRKLGNNGRNFYMYHPQYIMATTSKVRSLCTIRVHPQDDRRATSRYIWEEIQYYVQGLQIQETSDPGLYRKIQQNLLFYAKHNQQNLEILSTSGR